jgi:hypothetical protein
MVQIAPSKANLTTEQLISRIIMSGEMSRQDHLHLASAMLSYHQITEEERCQINRAFDYLQTGRLKLVD